MKKGISPIVAVVLLIAIAVIAAVGLYFWVGGLATKQPTPSTPATISVYAVHCGSDTENTTIMIANTSPPGTTINVADLKDSLGWVFTTGSDGTANWTCDASSIDSGNQVACKAIGSHFGAGDGTIAIFGNNVASATVTC